MKKRIVALAAAASLFVSLTGCTLHTPSSVGNVGGVDVPAGLYLLYQYSAYQQAASQTTDTNVLKAMIGATSTASSTAADSTAADSTAADSAAEPTATPNPGQLGKDYIAEQTLDGLKQYAAVETLYSQLGGELDEDTKTSTDSTVDSVWSSNGDLYQKNGIGKESLKLYYYNNAKKSQLADLLYGQDGAEAVSDEELTTYIEENYVRGNCIFFPLIDMATYASVTEEQKTQIEGYATALKDELAAGGDRDTLTAKYLTSTLAIFGQTYDDSMLTSYSGDQTFAPSDLDYYGEDFANTVKAAKSGETVVANMGFYDVVFTAEPVLDETNTLDTLRTTATEELGNSRVTDKLTELKDNMEVALDSGAMNSYAPSHIKTA